MSSNENFRVIISGGGTGGHVYPGIAIANKLKEIEPDVEITFVGVKNRIEAKIVPKEGYPLKTIHIRFLPRNKRRCGFYQVACLNERLAVVE